MSHEVVTTTGGALAVRDREVGEVMHPVVGPRAESGQLYVAPSRLAQRLEQERAEPLVLLDVGLGAGSNAVAALQVSEARREPGRRLQLVSFDRTTAALELALTGGHAHAFGLEGEAGVAARELLNTGRHESATTTWSLVLGELPGSLAEHASGAADIVFWDPFSPKANPELWGVRAFTALYRVCGPRATVHTYSAATSTRSALLLAGFAGGVGGAAGSKGQTTVAAVDAAALERPLGARWLERLARSSAPLPEDAPRDAMEQIQSAGQFQK
jgi:queuine tRNA-ribosyltransferase